MAKKAVDAQVTQPPQAEAAATLSAAPGRPAAFRALYVGYSTEAAEGGPTPVFTAPKNYVKPEVIEAYLTKAWQEFRAQAADIPYVGRVKEIVIFDPVKQAAVQFDDPKRLGTIPGRVAQYLAEAVDADHREVLLIGFEPRRAVQSLVLQGAAGHSSPKIPPQFWYGADCYREIGKALIPSGLPCDFELLAVVQHVLAHSPPPALAGWEGPGSSPVKDAAIAAEIGIRLGFHGG